MKTDDICEEYAPLKVDLKVELVRADPSDTDSSDFVLIEGSSSALKFLSEILLAISSDGEDSHRYFSKDGPGAAHISDLSNLGIYINKI